MKHIKESLFTTSVASRTIWLGLFFSVLLLHFVFAPKNTVRGEQLNSSSVSHHSLLILATNHVSEAKLMELQQLAKNTSLRIDYKLLDSLKDGDAFSNIIAPYQMVIFDSVSGHEAELSYAKFTNTVKTHSDKIFLPIKLLKGTPLRQGVSDEEAKRVHDYYDNGGTQNFHRMLAYLETRIFEKTHQSIQPPIIFPKVGIYHPQYEQKVFPSLDEYIKWKGKDASKTQTTVGIAMSKEAIASNQTQLVDEFIQQIEERGGLALPFYFVASPYGAPDYTLLLQQNGQTVADVIINTRILHWASARKTEFEKLGVPVIQALPYSNGDQKKWENDNAGIPAMAIPFFLTYAEIAGAIDPMVVAAVDQKTKQTVSIDYQLHALMNKVFRLAKLKHTPNKDKHVAIMFYNYPPGEKNASASFLNIPESLENISEALIKAGYQVDQATEEKFVEAIPLMLRPFYRNESFTQVLKHELGGLLPLSTYTAWYKTLPQAIRTEIETRWGEPKDSFTVYEIDGQKQFVIPRIKLGNLLILPQPPRGNNKNREQEIYHSQNTPVSHNYLATYLFTHQQFHADAIVHLGTHGTQEWLPGKERGLSAYDDGYLPINDIPVIYPFIVDNVGEAMQTKRRGRALVISHLTPPFRKAGLYRELAEIDELMNQYDELEQGSVKAHTKEQIIDLTIQKNIHKDLAWSEEDISKKFEEFLPELHDHLHAMAQQNQPLGLHSFGQSFEPHHLTSTMLQMLGSRFVELAQTYGTDLLPTTLSSSMSTSPSTTETTEKDDPLVHTIEYRLVDTFVVQQQNVPQNTNPDLRTLLLDGRTHFKNLKNQQEIQAILHALDGKYVSTSAGGGPINNPDSLPTGRNLYGFDPSKIPTKAAYEAGKELMDNMLATFYVKHERYPAKVTFNLWSIETMRHLGVLESQILHAMGVKPIWNEQGKVTGTEIIPYSELKRPRVDVIASPTGLYRDAFPNVMMLISKAVQKIADLKGEHNYVAQHAASIKRDLLANGLAPDEAEALSTIRFFSTESGEYGTGLEVASLASDTWETDDKLANMYLDRMGYFYGSDEKTWGQKLPEVDLYAMNLTGTDAVLFSRSSNIYGMMTSDDPFQYFGGISLAVRHLDGKSPEMFISDLRDKDNRNVAPLSEFISTELRSRYFHPKWIEEMQEEGYSGTLAVLDTVNNFWGWQVVDPDSIRDDQWQGFHDVYVNDMYDMKMKEWFETNNPEALAQIAERMLEAIRKGYWDASDLVKQELAQTYLELAKAHDINTSNEQFKEYLQNLSAGYGLGALPLVAQPASSQMPTPPAEATPATQTVEGQMLEKVQPTESTNANDAWYLAIIIFIFFIAGVMYQLTMRSESQQSSALDNAVTSAEELSTT